MSIVCRGDSYTSVGNSVGVTDEQTSLPSGGINDAAFRAVPVVYLKLCELKWGRKVMKHFAARFPREHPSM